MKLKLSAELVEKIPGIMVLALVIKNIDNTKKSSIVAQLLRGVVAEKKGEAKNETKKELLTKALKTTVSGEQVLVEGFVFDHLHKKASKGTEIKSENKLLDLAHFFSLKTLTPAFGHDLDEVDQDLVIQFETLQKKKKTPDFDYSIKTKNLVIWFLDIGLVTKEKFLKVPEDFAKLVVKYCGGNDSEMFLLNADSREVDLAYISQKEEERKVQMAQLNESVSDAQKPVSENANENKEEKLALDAAGEALPDFLQTTPVDFKPEPMLKEVLAVEVKKVLDTHAAEWGLDDASLWSEVRIEHPRESSHGDYSSNVALKLAKSLKKAPLEVAQMIKNAFPQLPFIGNVEIAAPGFVNFTLSTEYLTEQLSRVLQLKQHFGKLGIGLGKKVLVEYSSPNIAKPLGVHHLLSTIIGQTIANIYRYAGYEEISLNYLGDWGTQFGKLLYAYKNWGDETIVKQDPLNELLKLYTQFHKNMEQDPTLEEKGREEFKKLEQGDEENNRLWTWIRELSMQEVQRLYQKLGVHFDHYLGERMYLEPAQKLVEEGKTKGIVTLGEKGAWIIEFENEKYPPYMVQKGDGTTLYSIRDLASIQSRLEKFSPEKIIYVVDVAQKLHFEQLFETAKLFGFTAAELVHVVFGRMSLPEGPMSTRNGEIILMNEVIRQGTERALKLMSEKNKDLTGEDAERMAEQMAISAIKYNIISQNPETNMVFEWDRMLSLDGNSAPYLEYSYARSQSILRKSTEQTNKETKEDDQQTSLFTIDNAKKAEEEKDVQPFGHAKEQELLHLIVKFPEIIETASKTYKPNFVCTYLYDLAKSFNSFYQEVPVLSTQNEELKKARIELVKGVSQVLKNGMQLLGIAVFEKM